MTSMCRNCGHPIQKVFWFYWQHLNTETNELSTCCREASDCSCALPEPERRK